ncbi:MAG: hypothetical protein QOC59_1761 [Microbacteriaceae bacterium]|nr:hypothetical protein [Microbacteriaceae bacterium]
MEAGPRISDLLAVARSIAAPGRPASDDTLLESAAEWEALGRIVDGRRAAAAAEVEWRSRPQLNGDGLAASLEEKSGSDLLAVTLRISPTEAKRRIRIGTALAPCWSLTMEEGPARFPAVADAVRDGEVGLESARMIVDTLQAIRRRAVPEEIALAEQALTETSRTVPPEVVGIHAQVWAMRLDPDGAEPAEELQRRQRALHIGRTRADGITPGSLLMPPEQLAVLKAALDAHRRGIQWTRGGAADEDEDVALDWHEAEGDQRTRAEYDFDTFFAVFTAGVRAEQEGLAGSLTTPHEVITVVRAEELEARRGAGYPDGISARFSIPTVERLQCGGTSRLLVTGPDGEPLYLGRRVRLFTRAQRRALAVRDGGCAWPGCTAPIAWTEAHHVAWFHRDDGPSDISNGVLLCSHHHHVIHSTSRWEIRLHDHRPHLVPH